MTDQVSVEDFEKLKKQVEDLVKQNAELRAKIEPPEVKPRAPMPKYDPTEGFRLPPSAAQAMARVVPDVKPSGFNAHAWAQTKAGSPSGFGPPKWEEEKKPQVTKAEQPKPVDTRSPQTRMFDDMVAYMVGGPNSPVK